MYASGIFSFDNTTDTELYLGMHIPAGQRQELIQKAKRLYIAGYSIQEIAKVLDLNRKTIGAWRKDFAFDEAKDKAPLSLAEIVSRLQRHFQDKMDTGKLTADDVAKYAAAIERLTDKNKLNFYLIEAFRRVQTNVEMRLRKLSKTERALWLQVMRKMIEVFEEERKKVLQHEVF